MTARAACLALEVFSSSEARAPSSLWLNRVRTMVDACVYRYTHIPIFCTFFRPFLCIALPRVCHRRELALRSREVTAELGLLSLRVQKSEAAVKEGASAAREKEERVLKEHQVGSKPPFNKKNSSISSVNYLFSGAYGSVSCITTVRNWK